MKINISKLIDNSQTEIKLDMSLSFHDLDYNGKKLEFIKPLIISGGIYKSDNEIIISGSLTYEYIDICDRCLEKFPVKREVTLSANVVTNPEEVYDSEELTVHCDNGYVDLDEVIISTILVDLPMKSICNENCEGFCSKCGKNLNEDKCDCKDNDIDPRLAKLKELMD